MKPVTEYNLDAMTSDELWEFIQDIENEPVKSAKMLFPEKPASYVSATKRLAAYAWNKYTAMALRRRGYIERARVYENVCNRIYNNLPKWAKGW